MSAQKKFSVWVSKERSKLHPFQKKNIRNWKNCADVVHKDGVSVTGSIIVAPYPPEVIATLVSLHLPSIQSSGDILKFVCEQEL